MIICVGTRLTNLPREILHVCTDMAGLAERELTALTRSIGDAVSHFQALCRDTAAALPSDHAMTTASPFPGERLRRLRISSLLSSWIPRAVNFHVGVHRSAPNSGSGGNAIAEPSGQLEFANKRPQRHKASLSHVNQNRIWLATCKIAFSRGTIARLCGKYPRTPCSRIGVHLRGRAPPQFDRNTINFTRLWCGPMINPSDVDLCICGSLSRR